MLATLAASAADPRLGGHELGLDTANAACGGLRDEGRRKLGSGSPSAPVGAAEIAPLDVLREGVVVTARESMVSLGVLGENEKPVAVLDLLAAAVPAKKILGGVGGVLDELGANVKDVRARDGGHVLPLREEVGVGEGLGFPEAVEVAVEVTPGVGFKVGAFGVQHKEPPLRLLVREDVATGVSAATELPGGGQNLAANQIALQRKLQDSLVRPDGRDFLEVGQEVRGYCLSSLEEKGDVAVGVGRGHIVGGEGRGEVGEAVPLETLPRDVGPPFFGVGGAGFEDDAVLRADEIGQRLSGLVSIGVGLGLEVGGGDSGGVGLRGRYYEREWWWRW